MGAWPWAAGHYPDRRPAPRRPEVLRLRTPRRTRAAGRWGCNVGLPPCFRQVQMDAYASSSRSAHVSGASSCSLATPSDSPSRCSGPAPSLRRFSMSSGPNTVMIRRAGELSERMMTGQPLGAKQVAIASARTPAQSRNVTPARSRTSRSIRSSRTRAACCRNSPAARRSSAPPRMSVQTAGAHDSLAERGDVTAPTDW